MEPIVDFKVNASIKAGAGLLGQLAGLIRATFAYKRIGIVVDGNVLDRSASITRFIGECRGGFDDVIVYAYREKFEPTYALLDEVKREFWDESRGAARVDAFVGIGGGSVIDLAKGLAVLMSNPGPALQYRGFPEKTNRPLPVIAVPTTAGTGTEVTFNAVFIEKSEKKKLGINLRDNYPVLAVLDPELISLAPRAVLVSSGVDALVHTLESFVSVKATPTTRLFSKAAFDLIMRALPVVAKSPSDLAACADMQWAAALAMMALSNSSSGPTGALSYYLGSHYNVPHGIAGGLFLREITRINHELGYHGYGQLANQAPATTADSSAAVVADIVRLLDELGVPSSLRAVGLEPGGARPFLEYIQANYRAAFAVNPVNIGDDITWKMLERMTS